MTARAAASIILPAHDEAEFIGACLEAVLASDLRECEIEILVIANGCSDDTARIAREAGMRAPCPLRVIEMPTGDKLHALRLGDEAAVHGARIYLDADVIVSRDLIRALTVALARDGAFYATGTPRIARARSPVTRAYARFWRTLPFVRQAAPGFGLFAVNAAGRARWGDWPAIISDDTFARLHFGGAERAQLPQTYDWPMVEGFARLVRVRRRQDRGVAEIAAKYPALMQNDTAPRPGLAGLMRRAGRDPAGFAVYVAVALATRLPGRGGWARGR
ncbi:glycosyltransferase [Roseovarius spongiae]|uniref:Glycosyltransferase n=1 Tax=Roseovarius spongiae TaxID=2320272 RepID=A0A3A8AWY0_9RHOB|nr:glycosyltransferase [Roseovarius spongiae]RKF16928.1 glycosyltransferase [Roseovarius spongiae]